MQRKTINGTVKHTVIVSPGGRYGSPLIITATGDVTPARYGATGVIIQDAVQNASVSNAGAIVGGDGSASRSGGMGVDFRAAGTLENSGTIAGGSGNAGMGGLGVQLDGGALHNTGLIIGGGGAMSLMGSGGAGGAALMIDGSSAMSDNAGNITGGAGGYGYNNAGAGGSGIELNAASLTNTGTITGGQSGGSYLGSAGAGVGVDVTNGSVLDNAGLIVGGAGNYAHFYGAGGAAGVSIEGGAVSNSGTIIGGAANNSSEASPGNGGAGVTISGGTLVTSGTIIGGAGGSSGLSVGSYGGGVGIVMTGGAVNASGTITGGAAQTSSSFGGAGAYLDGGTLTTSAVISAGAARHGTSNAVMFGSKASTLTIEAGASFHGLVAADPGHGDQLRLGGAALGTLTGVGTEFTGFAGLTVDAANAGWTLTGSNTLGAANLTVQQGTLQIAGTLTASGYSEIQPGGMLAVTSASALQLTRLALAGGTLDDSGSGIIVIGDALSGAMAGAVTIDAGAGLHGVGTISGNDVVIDGALVAQGGELRTGALSGSGVAIIDGAVLDVQGAISVADLNFKGVGTLTAGQPTSIDGTINYFGVGDVIDLQHLSATTLSFLNGTLTLDNGTTPVATLHFAGDYNAADFALQGDGRDGENLVFSGTQDHAAFAFGGVASPGLDQPSGLLRADDTALWRLTESLLGHLGRP